jgi:hypothetical protein
MQIFTYNNIEYDVADVVIDGDFAVISYGSHITRIPLADYDELTIDAYGG